MDHAASTVDLPPGYPSEWETDVVLTDGATVHVRPIRPDDGARLLAFHARQSPESIYYRYFSPRPRLTDHDVEHLTHLDYEDRMALIALRGDEMIGVARYDRWRHRSEAEVAFFVDDEHQGRGLATVLLEHLAAHARATGITAFTASVLPQNRRMIGVFRQAGFESASRFEDGVVEVRLGLQPTPEAESAIEARAATAAAAAVRRLLSPRSVAVIGASRDPGTVGHDLFVNLLAAGFEGPVWPVNANARHVASVAAVASILDIPGEVDLAVVAVPADQVPAVVEECGRKQVYAVVIVSAGFAETGEAGARRETEVLRLARRWGTRVVGPNCLGVVNTDPAVRLNATFTAAVARPGAMGLLSESGMIGAAIVDRARELRVGTSSFVALGNRADVSVNDMLQYWEGDDTTRVVALYIESFGNPHRFSGLARRLSRVKPVLAVKPYATPGAGHPDPVSTDALLRQTGVIRVPTLAELLDAARLLAGQPLPPGGRVAVIGNAGGSLLIAADAVSQAGLELATLAPSTLEVLAASGPGETRGANPVDLGLRADGPQYERCVRAVLADHGVDAAMVLFGPSLGAGAGDVATALAAAADAVPGKPVAVSVFGPRPTPAIPAAAGMLPVYDGVEPAARALGHAARYSAWLAEPEGERLALADDAVAEARAVVDAVLEQAGATPVEVPLEGVRRIAAALGASLAPIEIVSTRDEAVAAASAVGFPVALKAARRSDLAKTAAAGLALDLGDEGDVAAAWDRMVEHLGEAHVVPAVVQAMVGPGVDAAITLEQNPEVGPVLGLRPGGATGALEPVVDVRVLPVTDLDARRLVTGSRLGAVLDPDHAAHLELLLQQVAALADEVPEVRRVALNPVVVCADGAHLTDVRIVVAPVEREPLPPIRRVG